MRYSERFEEDYAFYLANKDRVNFCGKVLPNTIQDDNGVEVKEAFWMFDTKGKLLPCRDAKLLAQIINCKRSVNWQIKNWFDDPEMVILDNEIFGYVDEIFINHPKWVMDSCKEQAKKRYLRYKEYREKYPIIVHKDHWYGKLPVQICAKISVFYLIKKHKWNERKLLKREMYYTANGRIVNPIIRLRKCKEKLLNQCVKCWCRKKWEMPKGMIWDCESTDECIGYIQRKI